MFYKITSEFIGKPFKPGGMNQDGYDCIGLVYRLQEKLGKQIPDNFKEWNKTNYAELAKDREKMESILVEYFDSFAKRADVKYLKIGDILIVEMMGTLNVGVYVGKNQTMMAFEKIGIRTVNLGSKIKPVLAWRIE